MPSPDSRNLPASAPAPAFDPDGASLPFVEGLYLAYLEDPASVSEDWRAYFQGLAARDPFASRPRLGPSFRPGGLFRAQAGRAAAAHGNGHATSAPARAEDGRQVQVAALQDRVDQLIRGFRVRGHLSAQIDPLGIRDHREPEIDPSFYGLTEADLDRSFSSNTIQGPERLTLRQILARLRDTYCRSIGVQFYHIDDIHVRRWLQERMEGTGNRLELAPAEQIRILTRLTDAVIFEEFIQRKFLGAKSFSLEGSESLIPLLDLAIEKAGEQGLDEVILGMAHRGRLNVLANIMGKSPGAIFREFVDPDPELYLGRGDVKYHLGYSSDWTTAAGRKIHLSLSFNPSHLEFVGPVALGRLRAKQDRIQDRERAKGMAILIHGDAAFAGEGIVQETLNLSQLEGYSTGGALHIIVNNQIGFTTAPREARSTTYATDVAKMLQIPIFHVNGEDCEAVAQVVRLALDFRREFKRDVVIDMYGYRRRGHNEGDEPTYTQPLMYQAIERRPSVREGYLEHLLKLGGVTRQQADEIALNCRERLEKELEVAKSRQPILSNETESRVWKPYHGGPESQAGQVETGAPRERLAALLEAQTRLPAGFRPHPKIEKWLEARREMAAGRAPLDWSAAEALALATLAVEGHPIRMSGQDCRRGTFSHRHAALYDTGDGHVHIPLQHLAPDQGLVEIHNSPLSEAGVLGFEYGYSLDRPKGLQLWEAQFGDFINAAQVIVDQFIASAEDKWKRLSGLVLLLPHGFEGMGPEHSSARLERFLMLGAGDNIQVVNLTTPAQYFHCLRRQVLRAWRKPLVVMAPKSLLRHPSAVSPLDDLAAGAFHRILPDTLPGKKRRVVLCSGKLYYDLERRRKELGREDVAILRVEQLYPFPHDELHEQLTPLPSGTPVVWVQEEPENMGAWRYLRCLLGEQLLGRLPFAGICRPAVASPATGSASSHQLEQRRVIAQAFGEA